MPRKIEIRSNTHIYDSNYRSLVYYTEVCVPSILYSSATGEREFPSPSFPSRHSEIMNIECPPALGKDERDKKRDILQLPHFSLCM